jgi:hypothetical protein
MGANVRLSTEEMRLVTDPAWILTKNSVIAKAVDLFGELSGEWREMLPWDSNPKISRGEQYKGFPWVILDYPRIFGKEDVLAVRTLFWWGHCFSVTLHLKGSYLRKYLNVIRAGQGVLEAAGFRPGTSEDEWEHEHQPGAWATIGDRPWVKISVNIGLDKWNDAPEILTAKFAVLSRILVAS